MKSSQLRGVRYALRRLLRSELGQGMVEYALIVSVVALGSLGALAFLGDEIGNLFDRAGSQLSADGTGGNGAGGTPPPNGTPVNGGNGGTPGGGGLPGPGTGNDNPVFVAGPGNGPAGFENVTGVFYGDYNDTPPNTYPVTVTELGIPIVVRGCSFTINGYQFIGVWLREPTATIAGDWTYNGTDYEWACINGPAFTVVDATNLNSNFTAQALGFDLAGQEFGPGTNTDTGDWASAGTSTSPAGNSPGIYASSGESGNGPWYYFHPSNGTVWLCTWRSTPNYTFPAPLGSGRNDGCLAEAPDTTPPTVDALSLANGAPSTAGRLGQGDTVVITFSEAMDPESFCPEWSGASAGSTFEVQIIDGGGAGSDDAFDLTYVDPPGGGNTCNPPGFGDIDLGDSGYTSGDETFSATVTLSGATLTIVIGARSSGGGDSTATVSTSETALYNPYDSLTDVAGNPIGNDTVSHTGVHF